jgi:hypothetical protein
MSGEKYLLLFNSQGSNVVNNSNLNSVSYDVDWSAFLPTKYKKFKCNFVFKSIVATGLLSLNGLVNMNVGKQNIFDGNSPSYNIGNIIPVSNATGSTLTFLGTAHQVTTTVTVISVTSGTLAVGNTIQLATGVVTTIVGLGTGTGGVGTYIVTSSQTLGTAGAPFICYASTNIITSYYSSAVSDNNDFYIDYPSNQLVTINLRQFDNTALLAGAGAANTASKTLHYILTLCLEGVEE